MFSPHKGKFRLKKTNLGRTKKMRRMVSKARWLSGSAKHPARHKNQRARSQRRKPVVCVLLYCRVFDSLTSHTGGPRVEVEYEHEMESVPLTKEVLRSW